MTTGDRAILGRLDVAETTQSDSVKGVGSVTMLTNRKVEKVSTDRRTENCRYRTLFVTRRALVTRILARRLDSSYARVLVGSSTGCVPPVEITRRRYVAYVGL